MSSKSNSNSFSSSRVVIEVMITTRVGIDVAPVTLVVGEVATGAIVILPLLRVQDSGKDSRRNNSRSVSTP